MSWKAQGAELPLKSGKKCDLNRAISKVGNLLIRTEIKMLKFHHAKETEEKNNVHVYVFFRARHANIHKGIVQHF